MGDVPDALYRRWVHSFEEDSGAIAVYRPQSFAFPPARGRDGLEFTSDGRLVEWRIGRGDASEGVEGRWQAQGPDLLIVSRGSAMTSDANVESTLDIVELNDDVLKVRRS